MARKRKLDSIYDLARETGVSYTTVSRVLNGRGRISEATRKKVLAVAERHNFKPKMQARRLTVSLLFGHYDSTMLQNEYLLQLLGATVSSLAQNDVAIEFHSKHNLPAMRTAMLDGVLGIPWDQMSREMLLGMAGKLPCVVVNDHFSDSISSVMSDHCQGGRMAAEHLLAKGHRKASVFVSRLASYGNAERVKGFLEAYADAGVSLPSNLVFDHPKHSVMEAISSTLKSGATAMFFGASMAGELMATARSMKVSIPEELSIVAMEGVQSARYQEPPLTALEQSLDFVAAKAVELLLRKISGEATGGPEHLLLDANRLVERESVKSLNEA